METHQFGGRFARALLDHAAARSLAGTFKARALDAYDSYRLDDSAYWANESDRQHLIAKRRLADAIGWASR